MIAVASVGAMDPGEVGGDGASGSRLEAEWVVGADGSRAFRSLRDVELDDECSFRYAADGRLRCLPADAEVADLYADASCTTRLALVATGSCAPRFATMRDRFACPTRVHVFAVEGTLETSDVYVGTPGNCAPISTFELRGLYDLYALGAEVPPSSFVAGTLETP
jgi:hypothetical protein